MNIHFFKCDLEFAAIKAVKIYNQSAKSPFFSLQLKYVENIQGPKFQWLS